MEDIELKAKALLESVGLEYEKMVYKHSRLEAKSKFRIYPMYIKTEQEDNDEAYVENRMESLKRIMDLSADIMKISREI